MRDWSDHLLRLARGSISDLDVLLASPPASRWAYVENFRDDHGHKREVDAPFLAHALALAPPESTPEALEVRLWRAVAAGDGSEVVDALPAEPPLIDRAQRASVEVWTEAELSALHALRWLAPQEGAGPLATLVDDVARWHVEHLQPDNATNHPWAVGVFVEHWARGGDSAARLHAETLVHNSLVATGRPDRFSAWILLDASRQLGRTADGLGRDRPRGEGAAESGG